MIADGQLTIVAGKVASVTANRNGLHVDVRRRGEAAVRTVEVEFAINCTGPLHAIARSRNPLLRALLSAGEVAPDHLGIGFEAGATDRVGHRLWALGPLTKARYWEIIAVPDIREQAAAVAEDIERELGA
jgi:uncharacterized NAD(P)/FAD-binding protein YdhS